MEPRNWRNPAKGFAMIPSFLYAKPERDQQYLRLMRRETRDEFASLFLVLQQPLLRRWCLEGKNRKSEYLTYYGT